MQRIADSRPAISTDRTAVLLQEARVRLYEKTDRLFAGLIILQWFAGIAAALLISPRTWIGGTGMIHVHVWAAIFLGGVIASLPVILVWRQPGQVLNRHVIAVAQMLTSALLIHLSGGRIETHFHIFGSLAFLAFYRDWRVIITATLVTCADHILRGILWPQSIFGVFTPAHWRWVEHALWVLFEDIFLLISIRQSNREMAEVARRSEHEAKMGEAVRESERRYSFLADTVPLIMWTTQPDGHADYFNEAWYNYTGLTAEESMESSWLQHVLHPEDLERVIAHWGRCVATGEDYEIEYRFRRAADGAYRWHLGRSQ
ncbi:MAG: PAS domain-containing protein, partial [Chthoniobacteraceae bacterium]